MIVSQSNMFDNKHIYGNTLEAFIGAIFIDKGYQVAKRYFIKQVLEKYINLDSLQQTETDFKSRLIEWGQKFKQEIIFNSKEDPEVSKNSPIFLSEVIVDNKIKGKGIGNSKKEAEQNAANMALKHLNQVKM